ncbi:hypothetical protein 9F7_68 [uncultured Caudovirales phage]|uniref:Uncharacterized protein n=1 Tax=uncultured Caudovirales phage TaxID=2100421 RepID=A0A2H4J0S5_9CAUD|nr:hypothetical protein 3S4_64 [uncultured Caudovirales phage]ASN68357.1 hypothetical protein 3F6_16 [uncultured Caudovirales phage]ASN68505.1 hypothetical protein 9F7_68 [uncultured Caudovirales phage]ASN68590.1 hypothetical protein 8S7_57 [uncultured Caudovirales phage]ASN72139.1 hypothetical protein 7F6_38 [uncultured Caudovirales phage]
MSEMTREEAYAQIAQIAEKHALIAQAFGGVITVVHPETQRAHGIEEKCLYMAGQGKHPEAKTEPVPAANKPLALEQPDLFES